MDTEKSTTEVNAKVDATVENENKEPRTFTRDEVGKMINAQVNKEKEKLTQAFKTETAEMLKNARDEWQKEQKMTEAELAEKQRKEAEARLAKRTAEVDQRERLLNAKDKLNASKLPLDLAEVLVGKTDEETDFKIQQFQDAVNQQLQNEIHKRTASQQVPQTGTTAPTQKAHKDLAKMSYAEMQAYLSENKE